MKKQNKAPFSPGLMSATGEIPEKLTNDVVLHSITQNSKEILRGLTASLLMIPVSEITEVELLNPIDYRNYADKEIILDIRAKVNNKGILNIELQMLLSTDSVWWINRSLLYLCRTFDNLGSGGDYEDILPSMQVCIVPKDVFSDVTPEFYSRYYMKNDANGHIYSRDFSLRVLYLNHTDMATDSDKASGLDYWAEAFLATTWEELKALADKGDIFRKVAEEMYTVNADVSQRSIAEAHRKYVETYTTLKNIADRAEKKAIDAEKAAEKKVNEAEKRADVEKKRAEAEKQRADAAEARVKELEATLKNH